MTAMDRRTGKPIGPDAHLAQSIGDILATPVGSRVMRRDYGSQLPDLVDAPLNPATRLLVFAASAIAIRRFEPRVAVRKFGLLLDAAAPGAATLTIEGQRTDLDTPDRRVFLSIPLRPAGAAPALP